MQNNQTTLHLLMENSSDEPAINMKSCSMQDTLTRHTEICCKSQQKEYPNPSSKLLKLIYYRTSIRTQFPLHHHLVVLSRWKGRGEKKSTAHHQASWVCNIQGTPDLLLYQCQHCADVCIGKHREFEMWMTQKINMIFIRLGNLATHRKLINTNLLCSPI